MKRLILVSAASVLASLLAVPAFAQSRLYLTEFTVTPTAAEMAEIYNPGPDTVDLSNYYITDATFQGGGTFYYNIVIGAPGGGGFGDFTARFPAGATIAPGEYQTIAFADADGAHGFFNSYGQLPTYECLGDGGFDDLTVPDMLEAVPGSINGGGGLTNSDEVVILFYWDGVSDLVTDIDYVPYGPSNETVDKTGVSIDGPDGDAIASTYANDTPLGQQATAPSPSSSGTSCQRIFMSEGHEISVGGNGIGDNETSENLAATWAVGAPTPNAASVGAVTLNITQASVGLWDFDLLGGTPGGTIVVVASASAGDTVIGQCPGEGFSAAIDGGEVLLFGILDGNGELHVQAHVSTGLGVAHIQVGDVSACRLSNVSVVSF